MFKRIFNKSKSSTRQSVNKLNNPVKSESYLNDTSSLININNNQIDFYLNPINQINLKNFIDWFKIWKDEIDQNKISIINKNNNQIYLEMINIYLNLQYY